MKLINTVQELSLTSISQAMEELILIAFISWLWDWTNMFK